VLDEEKLMYWPYVRRCRWLASPVGNWRCMHLYHGEANIFRLHGKLSSIQKVLIKKSKKDERKERWYNLAFRLYHKRLCTVHAFRDGTFWYFMWCLALFWELYWCVMHCHCYSSYLPCRLLLLILVVCMCSCILKSLGIQCTCILSTNFRGSIDIKIYQYQMVGDLPWKAEKWERAIVWTFH